MLKVLGRLAYIAIGCELLLLALVGPQGWGVHISTTLGEEIGRALAIFLFGAVCAGVVALVARRSGNPYPGFKTGAWAAFLMAAASLVTIVNTQGLAPWWPTLEHTQRIGQQGVR